MTRTMYDALPGAFASIPADAQLVAGYIDGGPGFPVMTDELWALFPHAVHVRIATQPATNDGHVLDVEAGDATPEQAPAWVTMRRAAGVHPSVYCSEAAWPDVRAQFAAQAVAEPEWWIAGYPGSVGEGNLYPGAVAHQWGGPASGAYDISAVADYWPGVDPAPRPKDDPVDYISRKADTTGAIYVTDWQTKRHINPAEWSLAQVLAALAGKPAPPVLPLDDDTFANIPNVGAITIDVNALATAIAAKLPPGTLTAAQVHAEVVAVLHSSS